MPTFTQSKEKYEILVCYTTTTSHNMKQNDNLFCGENDKKYTINQLYQQGYSLASSFSGANDRVAAKTLFFKLKK